MFEGKLEAARKAAERSRRMWLDDIRNWEWKLILKAKDSMKTAKIESPCRSISNFKCRR